jgi:two-component system KDP operon response regulator KdpE
MPTVLIVEDHKVTLDSLCLILERNGYHCLMAGTAEEAQRLFQSNAVDLVLLDYGLPDHNGGRLASDLKKMRQLPIVMISGASDLEEKPAFVDVLFAKPTDPSLLLKAIGQLLA